ncbi:AAA family ATPase [Niallia sp.]|uniref:ATP-binding protein n=1 Tax=Niallia sp. TaxID=2837523 RepID=UPI0028999C3C|nr:AAA family ATPase [Niallia sp.]
MELKKITIYGYGKLENKTFSIHSPIHVFYGENEAGKSTIMSFIHSILFGFPTKQQTELRYEPKLQHKYGGQLEILFPEIGLATIERVKGKASGDVTVTLEDGRRGQEELLNELLAGMDKGLYQSIFSFNLHGLQNVQQLKGEDLGRFLFSTGAVGSDRLLKVENELQKELDSRYKPSGKRPILNEKLQDLRERHRQLKIAEKDNNQYEQLLAEKDQLEKERVQMEEALKKEEHEYRLLEEWAKIKKIVQEKEVIAQKLEAYQEFAFPQNGLTRWESIKEKILSVEAEIRHLETKMMEIEKEVAGCAIQEELLSAETEILLAVEKLPVYEQLQNRQSQVQNQLKNIEVEIGSLKSKLHLPMEETILLKESNTSIFIKEQCAQAASKQRRLKEQKEELDERLKEEQTTLESLEETVKEDKKRLLPPADRTRLEERVKSDNQVQWNKEKAALLLREINQLEEQVKIEEKRFKKNVMVTGVLTIFLLLVGGVALFLNQWLLAIVSFTVCAVYFFLFFSGRKLAKSELRKKGKRILLIKEERDQLLTVFENAQGVSLLDEQKLAEDTKRREILTQHQFKLDQQNESYERVLQGFEKWEADFLAHQKLLRQLANELQIPYELATQQIYDAFLLIDEWKAKDRERLSIHQELEEIYQEKQQISNTIIHLFQVFIGEETETIANRCYRLKTALTEEKMKKDTVEAFRRKQADIKENMDRYQTEYNRYLEEKTALFSIAGVKEEEEFHEKAVQAIEKEKYTDRLSTIDLQLEMANISKEQIPLYQRILDPELQLKEKQTNMERLASRLNEVIEESASTNFTLSRIESGGIYTDLLHTFKQSQSEFKEDAREWAKFAVAKQLLAKTVERYKQKQLPAMLQKAEENLAFLTEGKYIRILPMEEGAGFLVESHQHVFYEAKELSQGTTEQLYLSIRIALAQTFYQDYCIPFIIDDSFVNFDEKRTEKVIQLLKKCEQNQLIFFTCHHHLLKYFPEHSLHVLPTEERETSL